MATKNSVEVNLMDGYFVEIDPLNYTLKQRYNGKDKDGNIRDGERFIGAYGNMNQCVESFMTLYQLDSMKGQSISFRQYVGMVENANKRAIGELKEVLGNYELK